MALPFNEAMAFAEGVVPFGVEPSTGWGAGMAWEGGGAGAATGIIAGGTAAGGAATGVAGTSTAMGAGAGTSLGIVDSG